MKFRNGSIFEPRRPDLRPKPGSIVDDNVVSPISLAPTERDLQPLPVFVELISPTVKRSADANGLGISCDGQEVSIIEEEDVIRADTSTDTSLPRSTRLTKEQIFKSAIVPDLVYRMQGIPKEYGMDETKELLRLKLELYPSDIDIQSLALSHDQRTQTALVTFNNASSETPLEEIEWSFRWYAESHKVIDINIDTHFIGLTMLCTPESAMHKIE